MSAIHVFKHRAMATHWEIRIADEEQTYAAQAAQAAFALTDELESKLSRFRADSEISHLAQLNPGETMRVTEPVFACLTLAKKMEAATRGAFSILATAAAKQLNHKANGARTARPRVSPQPHEHADEPSALRSWSLENFSVRCDSGKLEFDLGAIGKGFALDRMAGVLREWSCPKFLLVAGGSSILAGDAPENSVGWSCGLGDDNSAQRFFLKNVSLSGSGLAVQGEHIFDPRTGGAARRKNRAWALADTAAESDALSTAGMVLDEAEILEILAAEKSWLVFLEEASGGRMLGERSLPARA